MASASHLGVHPNDARNEGWDIERCEVLYGFLQTYTRSSPELTHIIPPGRTTRLIRGSLTNLH